MRDKEEILDGLRIPAAELTPVFTITSYAKAFLEILIDLRDVLHDIMLKLGDQ